MLSCIEYQYSQPKQAHAYIGIIDFVIPYIKKDNLAGVEEDDGEEEYPLLCGI
jgi:hypothetical protein